MNFNVSELNKTETPFYYYDLDLLHQTLDVVSEAISKKKHIHVHYAIKANANARILKEIASRGFGADCVSGGEIEAAINAGFPNSEIVYAGVGKADWEINLGLDNDIRCFNVESIPELEVINELAGKKHKIAKVAFRINPEVDAHTHNKITTGLAENKFGIAMSDMLSAIKTAEKMEHVEYVGLHFHIGSSIHDLSVFVALCHRINELQDELEANGIKTKSINVGGGLGIHYQDPDMKPISDFKSYFNIFKTELKLRADQELHFELGRSIVGQCGALISKVLYVKEGVNKKFLILDAGFTELIRPAFYDAYHLIQNLSATNQAPTETYDVVGPICESSDVFQHDAKLPLSHRNDLIAFRSSGAYGQTMASQYNLRKLVKEVYKGDI